jgi:hypothetical protein
MLYLAGTTKLGGKEVELIDNLGLFPIERLMGDNTSFYGGRVRKYGQLKSNPNILMLIEERDGDGMKIIDLATEKPEEFSRDILRKLLKSRKVQVKNNATNEEMIELVKTCIK